MGFELKESCVYGRALVYVIWPMEGFFDMVARLFILAIIFLSFVSIKVFAKAGLDIKTSTLCYYQQGFGSDVQFSALVHNFNNIFSNGHWYHTRYTDAANIPFT